VIIRLSTVTGAASKSWRPQTAYDGELAIIMTRWVIAQDAGFHEQEQRSWPTIRLLYRNVWGGNAVDAELILLENKIKETELMYCKFFF
jgi:hypothetical protein